MNSVVGDLNANATAIKGFYDEAVSLGADLVVTPELALSGYPPEDLLLKDGFLDTVEAAIDALCSHSRDAVLAVGAPLRSFEQLSLVAPSDSRAQGSSPTAVANSLVLARGGQQCAVATKRLLPNYDVFDEQRYFQAGRGPLTLLEIAGVQVGFLICEDVWVSEGPAQQLARSGAQLIVVANASPFARARRGEREAMIAQRVKETGCAFAYLNLVGGQDELVFDGQSFVVNSSGETLACARGFEEQLLVVDVELPGPNESAPERERVTLAPTREEPLNDVAEIYSALVLGTRDYLRKNGFSSAVVNLSGGIDSAIVAVVAADALGPGHVRCFALPSRYSSDHSVADAQELARRTGIELTTLPIEPAHDVLSETLVPAIGSRPAGLTDENLQSRIRGLLLMAISNATGAIALTTGNKSELATGYFTLYGDSVGGFAVIKDVSKTLVYELCRWRNELAAARGEQPPIPESVIEKAPSAELRPDQRDDQSLPPYDLLDPLLELYVEGDATAEEMIAAGHDRALVMRIVRLVDLAEYKRRQMPPGVRVSKKAFGKDRRMPITNRFTPAKS
jgi:NAD+ synthase (glutamine-hydrolysing)